MSTMPSPSLSHFRATDHHWTYFDSPTPNTYIVLLGVLPILPCRLGRKFHLCLHCNRKKYVGPMMIPSQGTLLYLISPCSLFVGSTLYRCRISQWFPRNIVNCNILDCQLLGDSHSMILHMVTLHSTSLLVRTLHQSESSIGNLFQDLDNLLQLLSRSMIDPTNQHETF